MFFFFFFLFLGICFLVYVIYKYRNPYKLTFIFGKKGAGKSCYMVRKMLWYLWHGWAVYTDMTDVKIPGVRFITVKDLETFRPVTHSALFLDEVGISMDSRKFKTFSDGLRDFFKYSRKMKCRVYMNSQAYDVDKKVRDTTDGMLLITSFLGVFSLCRPIYRSVTLTAPSAEAESRVADSLRFSGFFSWRLYYMPNYFRYFDSTAMPVRDEIPYELAESPDILCTLYPFDFFVKEVVERVRAFRFSAAG